MPLSLSSHLAGSHAFEGGVERGGVGGLRDRTREARQEKEKKTLGAIIPGSVLAAAVFFVISICFSVPQAWVQ